MTTIYHWIERREAQLESIVVRAMVAKLGIYWAVRYFRNPSHLATVPLLRSLGAKIGEGTRIKGALRFDNTFEDANSTYDFSHLTIGRNCYVGENVFFDLAHEVRLGDNVVVSGEASFLTHADCHRSPVVDKSFPRVCEPISVEDGAWIAFRAVVLSGVTIGANAVVAAHSLVRDNVKPTTLYGGSPAREIRSLG